MSEHDRETIGDDLGVWSVDDEDQLQPEDTLDGEGDVLDRGFRVGDSYRYVTAHGVTAEEQSHVETIEQRLRQEEPDPYVDDHARDGATEKDDAFDGDGSRRVGRIVAPDEGRYPDREPRMVAREGRASSWDSPEESAMHYVDGDEDDDLTEVEWEPADQRAAEDE